MRAKRPHPAFFLYETTHLFRQDLQDYQDLFWTRISLSCPSLPVPMKAGLILSENGLSMPLSFFFDLTGRFFGRRRR
jgi:hypothetical protein